MIKTTRAQRESLLRTYKRDASGAESYRAFRARVQPTFGMDGAIVVFWCGMFLAIETDGYTHS